MSESYSFGDDGVLKLMTGATTYNLTADFNKVTFSSEADMLDTTKGKTRDRTFKAGNKGWTASIECQEDADDTANQLDLDALVEGWGGSLIVGPRGETVGRKKIWGEILIKSVSRDLSQDGIATVSLSLQGTGALTRTTY